MKQSIISIIFLLLLCISMSAQETTKPTDIIILKDGSQFVGTLIDYNIDNHITIQTSMIDPLSFPIEIVDRVLQDYQNFKKIKAPYSYQKNYYQVEIGTPVSSEGTFGAELAFCGIRQMSSKLGLGLGVSYVNYRNNFYYQNEITRVPVFLIYRAYLGEGNIAPYFQLNAGYAFNPNDSGNRSGLHANPKLGVRFGQNGCMFQLFLGAHFTRNNSEYFENPWDDGGYEIKRTIQRTTIGLGISF